LEEANLNHTTSGTDSSEITQ